MGIGADGISCKFVWLDVFMLGLLFLSKFVLTVGFVVIVCFGFDCWLG